MSELKKFDRRDFIRTVGAVGFAGATWAASGEKTEGTVWQLDPAKCTQCGRCATHCVLAPSAV
jgi:Na+-translocating ferredoxin:NAD+ oxidoreductase subunit B